MAEPPSEQELLAQVEEELRKLKVSDLLVQTLSTVASLGYHRLGPKDRDLEEAKLAIEALRALVPTLSGTVPDEVVRDFNQVTANMQLAYVKAVSESPAAPPAEAQEATEEESPEAAPAAEAQEATDEESPREADAER